MAVSLALSYSERNDNKVLTLTDVTTNWGVGGNEAVTALTTLTLDVSRGCSDGTEVVYDQINLITLFGSGTNPEFPTQSTMVFPLTCAILKISGVAIGAATDELPDGIYTFTYVLDENLGTEVSLTTDILVEGKVRAAVYELLRDLPDTYNCKECKSKEILDTIYCYGLLNAMESSGYVAKNTELLNQLYVLERMVTNGSSYSW